MPMTVDQVTHWLILDRGIGHVLARSHWGWHYTACRTYTPNGDATTARPARVCRACRAALKECTPTAARETA